MFWATPRPLKSWDNVTHEEQAHTRWMDLFLDLSYVGVAANVGHMIEHALEHKPSESSGTDAMWFILPKALAIFFVLISKWLDNLQFYARFNEGNDTLHKVLDIIEFVGIGFASVHSAGVFGDKELSNFHFRGMAQGLTVASAVTLFRHMELLGSELCNVRRFGGFGVGLNGACFVCNLYGTQDPGLLASMRMRDLH